MVSIGKKCLGDDCPTFITFEAGATHAGLSEAKKLAEVASKAGADAIKFQIFDPNELISDKNLMFSYDVLVDRETGKTEIISEPLYDIFVRRSMAENEWRELKSYCDKLGIMFFATIGDDFGFNLVKSLGCESVKIASSDINYLSFLRKVSKLGVSVQIDTGNASDTEIATAILTIKECGNDQIILHHCPSGYPANLDNINLKSISTIKNKYELPVAFSDHSPGDTMDIAAICLGADLVEKTITLNRETRSVEHVMSIEPHEVSSFVKNIRNLERAFGSKHRTINKKQQQLKMNIRRSLILDQDVSQGQKLGDVKVKFQRPGFGIAPDAYEKLLEKSFKNNLPAGSIVTLKDFV